MFYLALFYLASMHIFICVLNMYAYVKDYESLKMCKESICILMIK